MFKKLLYLLPCFIFINSAKAQIYTGPLQTDLVFYGLRNILYANLTNDFAINSHLPIERWKVTASNGIAELWGDIDVKITPAHEGKDTIDFYLLTDTSTPMLALREVLHVEKLPDPELILGRKNKITKAELSSIKLLKLRVQNLQYDIPYYLKQCKILIIKENGQRLTIDQTGNTLNESAKKELKSLIKGDIVCFKDIMAIREKDQFETKVQGTFVCVE